MNEFRKAPALEVSEWFNTSVSLKLEDLRGKVVLLHAFQMLCPGCVSHGIPQASAIHEYYKNRGVQVIGIHSVFEHHDVMGKKALAAFIHEYRLEFPIAIDQPSEDQDIPLTMQKYRLRGTPSLVLIDQQGRVRLSQFGRMSDMQIGDSIGQLLAESKGSDVLESNDPSGVSTDKNNCNTESCSI